MSPLTLVLWVVVPYVSIAIFVAGHIWRYRHDQFGWTCRSTQLLESRQLKYGSILFHYGALAAIGGHVLGILIPRDWTELVWITEARYHVLSAVAGTVAGGVCLVGLAILVWRRVTIRRVWVTTTPTDMLVYALLISEIGLGMAQTVGVNVFGGGYDYRATEAVWFRDIFWLHPDTALILKAPLVYQAHALLAWGLYVVWPFSRLVHVWSYPVQYLGRAWIPYRRRFATAR